MTHTVTVPKHFNRKTYKCTQRLQWLIKCNWSISHNLLLLLLFVIMRRNLVIIKLLPNKKLLNFVFYFKILLVQCTIQSYYNVKRLQKVRHSILIHIQFTVEFRLKFYSFHIIFVSRGTRCIMSEFYQIHLIFPKDKFPLEKWTKKENM